MKIVVREQCDYKSHSSFFCSIGEFMRLKLDRMELRTELVEKMEDYPNKRWIRIEGSRKEERLSE